MLKKTKFTISIAMVILIIGGVIWLNISLVWTYPFTGISEVATQVYPADQNEAGVVSEVGLGDDSENSAALQSLFPLAYIILGAVLTAFAIFVSIIDYWLERQHGGVSFGLPRILNRH